MGAQKNRLIETSFEHPKRPLKAYLKLLDVIIIKKTPLMGIPKRVSLTGIPKRVSCKYNIQYTLDQVNC